MEGICDESDTTAVMACWWARAALDIDGDRTGADRAASGQRRADSPIKRRLDHHLLKHDQSRPLNS